jgi:hypothetical protein
MPYSHIHVTIPVCKNLNTRPSFSTLTSENSTKAALNVGRTKPEEALRDDSAHPYL